ncbi:hypothetical protein QWZ10_21065 [Paracoccus cavernae]|uniref:Uncharacterized protein n=1 Tax=Paracoccus cavernae TaxID=1571207 RepID=A0ABT8DA95_9RHOB|nr:hypothetical protein [Paracoccus cavernae]
MADLTEVLWQNVFGDPHYLAAIELMLAARLDTDLGRGLREEMESWVAHRDDRFFALLRMSPIAKNKDCCFASPCPYCAASRFIAASIKATRWPANLSRCGKRCCAVAMSACLAPCRIRKTATLSLLVPSCMQAGALPPPFLWPSALP